MSKQNQLPKVNFLLSSVADLSKNQSREYIDSYFYPLTNGLHAFYDCGKFEIRETEDLKKTYFNRVSKELSDYYFKQKTDIRRIVYEVNKPVLHDDCINLCPQMLHKYVEYKKHSEKAQEGVRTMLTHLKEVICSGDDNQYRFLLKWFANMIKGNKNNSCLYLKGAPQGSGKSTPIEFIREFVIGINLSLITGSGPLKKDFNKELEGKLMVAFEELESFGVAEWSAISSKLKRIITTKVIMIEGKGKDARECDNINNYILLSNNDAIKDDDGRRYFILDISSHRIGDSAYFNNLYGKVMNMDVGAAFYAFMMEVDLTNYNAQEYPSTKSKTDAHVKRLDSVSRFVKEKYVLNNVGIERITVGDLHEEYCDYAKSLGVRIFGKIDFTGSLKNMGIEYYKSGSFNYYKATLEKLNEIAKRFHWLHELDEFTVNDDNKENTVEFDLQTEINNLKAENKKLLELLNTQKVEKVKEIVIDKVKERKEIVESMIKQMKPKKKTKPVEIVIEKEIVIIPPKLYLGLTREQALELSDEQFVNMYQLYKHNEDKDRLFKDIERNLPYLKMCHKQIKEKQEAIKPKPVNMMMKPKKIEKTVVVKEVEEVELITKEDVEEAFSGSSFFSFSD